MSRDKLLFLDVGNTHTVIGVFEGRSLKANWRVATRREATADELHVAVANLFELGGVNLADLGAASVASVVPPVTASIRALCEAIFKIECMVIGPETDTGIPVLYDNPEEVGADRIANAVAGFSRYGGPLIIVDFGTATTFDAITERGEYLGGAIVPGLEVSSEALFQRAARLSKVDLVRPATVIGRNTRSSIQAGLIVGTGGLVDRIVSRFEAEMGPVRHAVATGGLAALIAPECERIDAVDQDLTLVGLQMIYERNHTPATFA